ncbi:MAG: ATP-dependent sacrificial sulfur transferase LarE [Acidobacteriota bacterium]
MTHPEPQTLDANSYAVRLQALRLHLSRLRSVAVAYSGGVDSTVLLHAATSQLGARAAGLLADSPSLPRQELHQALETACQAGLKVTVLATGEGENPAYRANQGDRCYHCKSALFAAMRPWAAAHGFRFLAFGEIPEDLLDDRPGARAAREFGVVAPLREAGLAKADVRRYAREAGLSVWRKPAGACLASRIPAGTQVTPERLARVEEAEEGIRTLGFSVLRVRHHHRRARVEIGADEMEAARSLHLALLGAVRAAGFEEMELALYRSPQEKRHRPPAGTEGQERGDGRP